MSHHLILYIIERDAHSPKNKGTEATGKKVSSTGAYLIRRPCQQGEIPHENLKGQEHPEKIAPESKTTSKP